MHTSSSRPAPVLLAAVLAGSVLLTGCGGDGGGGAAVSSSAGPATSSTPSASPGTGSATDSPGSDAPPFRADTGPDTADASEDARVTVSTIRIGRQDGFDRVVFEVGGTGTPGWEVRYVDAASSQGSGAAVDVAGDRILQVTLTGVGYPYDTGIEEYAGGSLTSDATSVVREVVWDATFEGTSVAFVGTDGQHPFRVYLLADPTRVVLDVADAKG